MGMEPREFMVTGALLPQEAHMKRKPLIKLLEEEPAEGIKFKSEGVIWLIRKAS